MSSFDIGDIVLVRSPHLDLSSQKKRPAIVVGIYVNDVIVVPMTSEVEKYKNDEFVEIIEERDLNKGKLNRKHFALLMKLNCIDNNLCRKVASLKREKLDFLLRKMSMIFPGIYYQLFHDAKPFSPGKSKIQYAGRMYNKEEIFSLINSSMDFWLTLGPKGKEFEKELANYIGVKFAVLVNSGSSANLLAFAALNSPTLENPIRPGDEVITVACGFPTTLNPIVQYGCIPVFIDVDLETVNIDVTQLEKARSERTRALMIAHTLGNTFDVDAVLAFCEKYNLYLIEDNCDALGSRFKGKRTGSFGHLATQSFYPPHHITMGEGGAILTDDPELHRIVLSLRDWGRDCWCDSGKDNTCGKRFNQQFSSLPFGYDHKYVYSHVGYSLKPLDLQAAIGLEQLKKLDGFVKKRQENYHLIKQAVHEIPWLRIQQTIPDSEPSWFAALLMLEKDAPMSRFEIIKYLEEKCKIQTRQLFGGNLVRQPAYSNIPKRIIGYLHNTDYVMNQGFFIGVWPGYTKKMMDYIVESLMSLKRL